MPTSHNPYARTSALKDDTGFVHAHGAREHNLKHVAVEIPRVTVVP
ncbi:MAG: hypothetical protein ABJA80_05305 [bacterium]